MSFDPSADPGSQKSIEWLMERCGKVTASRFGAVLAKLKNGTPAKPRQDYLWEVVIERLTGHPTVHYVSAAMERGTEMEPLARMAYEAATGRMVAETGFHSHPEIEGVGGSPDGLIDDDGGIEIKCPFNSAIHLQTWLNGMPDEHMPQIQGCMWITGRKWWDFVSYDDRMPERQSLYVQRILRDTSYAICLEAEIRIFLKEVDELLGRIKERA